VPAIRSKRIRRWAIISFLLAGGCGLFAWILLSAPRRIAEVTLSSVEATQDGTRVTVAVDSRNNTAWRSILRDRGVMSSGGGGSCTGTGLSSLMALLTDPFRPFPCRGMMGFTLPHEDGDELVVESPVGERHSVSSGEELLLISTRQGGNVTRSVSIHVESLAAPAN
jgi:hypothetical protein